MPIPIDINQDLMLAYNLGLGISSQLNKWVIRPEIGLLKPTSAVKGIYHISMGLSIYP